MLHILVIKPNLSLQFSNFRFVVVCVNVLSLLFEMTDNYFTNMRSQHIMGRYFRPSSSSTSGAFLPLWVQLSSRFVLLSSCACLMQNRARVYFLPLRGWCNTPDTWEHPHLSHTNPLVPKNTIYPLHPAALWKLMYCTCADQMGRCVGVICTVTLPSRFINISGIFPNVSEIKTVFTSC